MIGVSAVGVLARTEFRSGLRNRWILLYAGVFAALAVGVTAISGGELVGLERGQFGRTAAALTNVVLLVAPLFGLIAGAGLIAGDRERGTLAYYLSQPVSAGELFWGKFFGALAALQAALLAGFAVTALPLAARGNFETTAYVWLVALSSLLLLISFSVGVLISTLARRVALATSMAVFAWVALLFLGDLGLMATSVATGLDLRLILGLALANPGELFRVAAVHQIGSSLDALGPAGNYLVRHLGVTLMPMLLSLLVAWALLPAAAALAIFRRSDAA